MLERLKKAYTKDLFDSQEPANKLTVSIYVKKRIIAYLTINVF
jgi:hypothetical protein